MNKSAPEDYAAMTDHEFDDTLFRLFPDELQRQIAQASSRHEKEKLVEQVARYFPPEVVEAISERARLKTAEEMLAEPCSIVDLFDEAGVAVPPPLADLQLRPLCLSNTAPRCLIEWPNAAWSHIRIECRDLAEGKRWGLLDEAEQLCRAVEPLMREHPSRTLGEAFRLIAAEGK
jgi:hypothetical protein